MVVVQPGFISTTLPLDAASAEPEPETIGEGERRNWAKICLIAKRETRLLHHQWSNLGELGLST